MRLNKLRWALVVVMALPLGLTAVPSFGHLDPIEQRDLLDVLVILNGFTPLDSHDDFLRWADGEMQIRIVFFEEEGHSPTRDVRSPLIEGVDDREKIELNPAPTVYLHDQCHPTRTFRGRIEIWEDDSDGEVLAAFRSTVKQIARFTTGQISEIASSLINLILDITGLEEIVQSWLDKLKQDLKEALGDIAGELGITLLEAAAKLAVNAALGDVFGPVDQRLAQLVTPVREEINQLAKNLQLPGEVRNIARRRGQNFLDQGIDFVIDLLAGSGDDLVGVYEGSPFPRGINPGKSGFERIPVQVNTSNFNEDKNEGASLSLTLGVFSSRDKRCNRPPAAKIEIRPSEQIVIGMAVLLDGSRSTDPDLENPALNEKLTYSWEVRWPSPADGSPPPPPTGTRDSEDPTFTFVPNVEGEYRVVLTVKDSFGVESTVKEKIRVALDLPPPPSPIDIVDPSGNPVETKVIRGSDDPGDTADKETGQTVPSPKTDIQFATMIQTEIVNMKLITQSGDSVDLQPNTLTLGLQLLAPVPAVSADEILVYQAFLDTGPGGRPTEGHADFTANYSVQLFIDDLGLDPIVSRWNGFEWEFRQEIQGGLLDIDGGMPGKEGIWISAPLSALGSLPPGGVKVVIRTVNNELDALGNIQRQIIDDWPDIDFVPL